MKPFFNMKKIREKFAMAKRTFLDKILADETNLERVGHQRKLEGENFDKKDDTDLNDQNENITQTKFLRHLSVQQYSYIQIELLRTFIVLIKCALK